MSCFKSSLEVMRPWPNKATEEDGWTKIEQNSSRLVSTLAENAYTGGVLYATNAVSV